MTGVQKYRETFARIQAQRLSQNVIAPNFYVQLQNMSHLPVAVSPANEPPVLQNTNGTFVAQPLYDR